ASSVPRAGPSAEGNQLNGFTVEVDRDGIVEKNERQRNCPGRRRHLSVGCNHRMHQLFEQAWAAENRDPEFPEVLVVASVVSVDVRIHQKGNEAGEIPLSAATMLSVTAGD